MTIETFHEVILGALAMIATGAGGKVHRNHGQAVIHQLNVTPFRIDLRHTQTFHDLIGFFSCINPHTAIALLLGVMKVSMIPIGRLHRLRHIGSLCLKFLHTHKISPLFGQPIKKTFPMS